MNHLKNLLPKDGILIYKSDFFTPEESLELFQKLQNNIQWKSEKITIYGNEYNIPRLTAWYGDADKKYTYSGISMNPLNWTNELSEIKTKIELFTKTNFNSVLLNLYRSGKDHVSWHSDNERELGKNPMIASLSLGEERIFQVKHKYDKTIPTISLKLEAGSLVIMSGTMQDYWVHCISKTKKEMSPRINLTFRQIK